MKRRRVFQVVIEYNADQTYLRAPYEQRDGKGEHGPVDNLVTADDIQGAILYRSDGMGCEWFATAEVTEVTEP